ncbi:uncharacterized protein N7479_005951 [Penicillium vulpinum]|uniref:Uncharacterized protein n=1 Tax=Penicillium vulpinum TaxID=29845 RepID=A0A1V6SE75_9EURO|nr:uncharacterized protein N7479_005951 [Penicillium vulpinum]KAJ5958801.1 hypothetical protein N7479_005951 [Penicillium vulpinum]OQE12069.1 hypothetical protein PENVUL_c001G02276 [Penicillium vulpinum]
MAYTNTTLIMATITTTFFDTVVYGPSAPPSAPPSPAPSAAPASPPTAIENLSKLPEGLWALILLVVGALLAVGVMSALYFLFWRNKKGDKPNKSEEREKREETIIDDFVAPLSPQAALTAEWLRDRRAGKSHSRLRILVEPAYHDTLPPSPERLTRSDVEFVPVPPGFIISGSPPPITASPASDPAISPKFNSRDPATPSSVRNTLRHSAQATKESYILSDVLGASLMA